MKNIFILAAILLTNTLFSQNNNEFSTTINQVNFETDIKENYYLNDSDKFLNLFNDVNFLESNSKMNTERKFLMKSLEKENILSSNLKNKSIIVTKNKRSIDDTNSLITDTKSTFVKTIIEDKLKEELLKSLNANEALTYGDKNIDLYVEYEEMRNKLIKSYEINDSVEFQIGKSVYPYLNKILKTEIDKTLRNSLNLFVVNF
ncbi:hypothetical protein [Polaribacter dokdonensis]|uniref:Uncharacterized protein n=1 Tax=Polaribacter dokdonensis DSW-5 TaxID=1300348 RepID=A0A0M9CEE4_9FLAO|nr:hypothetical protein [Polaribacter dokdonensis]KOY50793.1 hypothetical protein I602_353 [Polaribacter dokdonensis DSW-5]SEE25969.1 hypothetical protein SAMN05444353_1432 [Polaribacter dokdonensis DSW-5]